MNLKFLVKVANRLDQDVRDPSKWASNAIDLAIESAKDSEQPYEVALASIASFASSLDSDGHIEVANILDTVLKTAAINGGAGSDYAHLYDSKANNEQTFYNAVKQEAAKAKEPALETWKGGNHPLLTRYSPDYPGVMLLRISDGVYQDTLSKKVYDFKNGFVSDTGIRYYGGSVAYQTPTAQNSSRSPMVWESQHLKVRPK